MSGEEDRNGRYDSEPSYNTMLTEEEYEAELKRLSFGGPGVPLQRLQSPFRCYKGEPNEDKMLSEEEYQAELKRLGY